MDPTIPNIAITILHPPPQQECASLEAYASVLRDLQLQAFRERPTSFVEDYTDISSQPPLYWQHLVKHHTGLIQVAFGISPSLMPTVWAMAPAALQFDVIMDVGIPLAFAIHPGPESSNQCLLPTQSVLNDPSNQELLFQGSTTFQIAHARDSQRGHHRLFRSMTIDRDEWLLKCLQAAKCRSPVVARFLTKIKAGANHDELLSFYARDGWSITDARSSEMTDSAGSGEEAMQKSAPRSGNSDGLDAVVEKVFTVEELERRTKRKSHLLKGQHARL